VALIARALVALSRFQVHGVVAGRGFWANEPDCMRRRQSTVAAGGTTMKAIVACFVICVAVAPGTQAKAAASSPRIRFVHSIVIARCQPSPVPHLSILSCSDGTPMLSKKNVFRPGRLDLSSSRTADVFPEPEAPITKYMVCMRGSYPAHGSFFNIAEPPGYSPAPKLSGCTTS
jgi:hypothetical protein